MRRSAFYLSVALLTFSFGSFATFYFNLKTERWFVVAPNEEIKSATIIAQNQTNLKQNYQSISQKIDFLKFDKLNINGVVLGSSYSIVLSQLGKPLESNKKSYKDHFFGCSDNTIMNLRYSGLEIRLEANEEGQNFRVVSMKITSSKWSVLEIKVGANIKEVQAKLQQHPYHQFKDNDTIQLHYVNGDGATIFSFRNSKLGSINWKYNFC